MRAEYKGIFIFKDPGGEWRFAKRRRREGCSQQGRRHKQRPRGRTAMGFQEKARKKAAAKKMEEVEARRKQEEEARRLKWLQQV